MGIEDQKDRLDLLDKKLDEKIILGGKDHTDLLEIIDQSIYNSDYLSKEIQTQLFKYLEKIDEYNIGEETKFLSNKIDLWISGEAVSESVSETEIIISEEFHQINSRLNIPEANLQIYYETALENNVDISSITQQLNDTGRYFLKGVDDNTKKYFLVEIFGKMVNGETENLINNELLTLNVEACSEQIKSGKEAVESLKIRLAEQEELQRKQLAKIAKLTVANADWFLWAQRRYHNFDDEIGQAIKDLESIDNGITTFNRRIIAKEEDIKELTTASLVSQYQYLSNNGEDTSRFVLMMKDQLGDAVPSFIQPDIDQALYTLFHDPNASEFDKLFYEGQYDEALSLLVEQNRERLSVAGRRGKESESDIINTYQRNYEADQLDTGSEAAKRKKEHKTRSELRFLKQIEDKFPEGSFALQKISKEGYQLIQIADENTRGQSLLIVKSKSRHGYISKPGSGPGPFRELVRRNPRTNLFLVKRLEDGSLKYLRIKPDGNKFQIFGEDPHGLQANLAAEYTINPEKQNELKREDLEMKANMLRIISTKPSFKMLQNASAELNKKVAPLQQLFHKSLKGNKTDSLVSLVKSKAREIKGSSALRDLKANLQQARADLISIRSFAGAGIQDEFEQQISQLEIGLGQISNAVGNNKIEDFCDYIISSDFDADTWGRWVLKTGLPFLTAIGVAVVAIVLAIPSGGTSIAGGLAIMATIGTAAGMVGHEVGTIGSHYLGQSIYGEDEFSNKTMLGKYITNDSVYNPSTGKWDKIQGSELSVEYIQRFAVGFITTFALLGLGQVAGQYLSRFAAANSSNSGNIGKVARLLEKTPRLGKTQVDLIRAQGFDNLSSRISKEFFQEIGQESLESGANEINTGLGFLVSLANCLNGRKIQYKLGEFDVASEGYFKVGDNGVLTKWSYDSSKQTEIVEKLTQEYGAQGFDIRTSEDGTVMVKKSATSKNGQEFDIIMEFKATTESIHARRLLGNNIDKSGKSEIERIYGIQNVGKNSYIFRSNFSEGKITLKQYLRKEGFVVTKVDDVITAVKGDNIITLRDHDKFWVEIHEEVDGLDIDIERESYYIESRHDIIKVIHALEAKGFQVTENTSGLLLSLRDFSEQIYINESVRSKINIERERAILTDSLRTHELLNNGVLTDAQINQIISTWDSHVEEYRYNNAAMTLDFMRYYRSAKANNPGLTIIEAYNSYSMSGVDIVENYNGGNCFALARNLQAKLKAEGIEADIIFSTGFNPALRLTGEPWVEALAYVDGAAHGSLIIKYQDPSIQEYKFLHLEMGVGKNNAKIIEGQHLKQVLKNGMYLRPNIGMSNLDESVLKKQLRTRNKLVIFETINQRGGYMEMNLMKGMIFLNNMQRDSLASDSVVDQTSHRGKRLSIDIESMLEKPKAPTRIEIDGKTEIVTNIEALHIILKVVGNDLGMDSDFANDVIFLYSNREDYYDSFMLSEASKLYSSTYSSAATRAVNQ